MASYHPYKVVTKQQKNVVDVNCKGQTRSILGDKSIMSNNSIPESQKGSTPLEILRGEVLHQGISDKSKEPNESNFSPKAEQHPPLEKSDDPVVVYFDLETGGLKIGVDILQIAAVNGEMSFMQYVTPIQKVSPKAQKINGLKNEGGILMKRISYRPAKWEALETIPIKEAIEKFIDWLRKFGPCVLVAHNVSFDKKHILYHAKVSGLHRKLKEVVRGFTDTLPFFRELYPHFWQGYTQENLTKYLLQETYNAHDALADVKTLQKLVLKTNRGPIDLLKYFSIFK